jgi:hypothetical protein
VLATDSFRCLYIDETPVTDDDVVFQDDGNAFAKALMKRKVHFGNCFFMKTMMPLSGENLHRVLRKQ